MIKSITSHIVLFQIMQLPDPQLKCSNQRCLHDSQW